MRVDNHLPEPKWFFVKRFGKAQHELYCHHRAFYSAHDWRERPYRLRAHRHRHIPGHPSVQLFRYTDTIIQASDLDDEEPSSGLDLGSNSE